MAKPSTAVAVAVDAYALMTDAIMPNLHGAMVADNAKDGEGEHADRLLVDMLQEKSRPLVGWRQLPLLSATLTAILRSARCSVQNGRRRPVPDQ